MVPKTLKMIFLLPVLVTILAVFCGCGTSNTQLNPYLFLSGVDSVDHTPFFLDAYQAFQVAGIPVSLSAEQIKDLEDQTQNSRTKRISR